MFIDDVDTRVDILHAIYNSRLTVDDINVLTFSLDGYTDTDIGEILGLDSRVVYMRSKRAINKIKDACKLRRKGNNHG